MHAATHAYSPNRRAEHAQALLEPCRGYLHADAFAGFNKLYDPDPQTGQPRLIEVACWAHARRELFDEHANTKSPAAREALEQMGAIFATEREINGQPPEARLAVRQARIVPLLTALKDFYETTLNRISRKGTLAAAIRYRTNRWAALTIFTTDGRLEMTNNAAERAIRPLTLGGRNWTFLGSDTGADRAAVFYTIIQTCRLNEINPEEYLADLIARIADHPAKKLEELLPWNWRPQSARAAVAA